MVPYNYTDYIDDLTSLVHKGIVNMSRIDDAVRRILRVKFTMGLFENPLADLSFADQLGKKVGKLLPYYCFHILHTTFTSFIVIKTHFSWLTSLGFMLEELSNCALWFIQEHRELAREAVRKSLVLLKNGNSPNQQFLPLPKKARRILVAGSHASNLGYQCGGWSIQWMGGSGDITTGMCTLYTFDSFAFKWKPWRYLIIKGTVFVCILFLILSAYGIHSIVKLNCQHVL